MSWRVLIVASFVIGCWAGLAAAPADAAIDCRINGTCCASVCDPGLSNCAQNCITPGGQQTTCGLWLGQINPDLDGDGVANGSDNCQCTANASQANCDGDNLGDACDPDPEQWVLIEQRPDFCFINSIRNQHLGEDHLYFYESAVYQDVCSGQGQCIDSVLSAFYKCDVTDPYDPWAAWNCCLESGASVQQCNQYLDQYGCGFPTCPF